MFTHGTVVVIEMIFNFIVQFCRLDCMPQEDL